MLKLAGGEGDHPAAARSFDANGQRITAKWLAGTPFSGQNLPSVTAY
jgi:hypothetical protein